MKKQLTKVPTGIDGLDEITGGGLPRGRCILVSGGAGCGKTLLATEFIVKGITRFNEPGVFFTFEESKDELVENVASLGFDLDELVKDKQLYINDIAIDPLEMVEAGEYDLNGLFAQLGYAIDAVGARRVVVDGVDFIFSQFSHIRMIRSEFKRLIRWLKQKKVTAIITGERGEGPGGVTKHGIEAYLTDCVVLLDQRVQEQIATRRLHVLKYRGTRHGTNEYPFLVTERGISVLPVTSVGLEHDAPTERVSTGSQPLDDMLEGKGYFKGSSVLVSGTAGTGKSSLAAHFALSVCQKGGRCIYFSFEESAQQIIRNMRSIGLELSPFREQGLLQFHALRPTLFGLESHLLALHRLVDDFSPEAVVLDPISNLAAVGTMLDIRMMFLRILDFLKERQITTLCTNLTSGGYEEEATEVGVSSIMDTWILLQCDRSQRRRKRRMSIIKSRGMAHSDQVHTFDLTNRGIVVQSD